MNESLEYATMLNFHCSEASALGHLASAVSMQATLGMSGQGMRRFESYALAYIRRGHGMYRDDTLECPIEAGDCVITLPGKLQYYAPETGTHWDETYILFSGAVFDLWRDTDLLSATTPVLHLQPMALWLPRFEALYTEKLSPLMRVGQLQSFLAQALESQQKSTAAVEEELWLDTANRCIREQLNGVADYAQIARNLGTSYESFRKQYKRLSGISPNQYRTQEMMALAAQMLIETSWPVYVIADKLHFCDAFQFSRRFKQVIGISPSDYRRRAVG